MNNTQKASPILVMEHISKRFPRVTANDDISLKLFPGEIIALLGENGAGKSTLMNILCGLIQPSSGKIYIKGREVPIRSPKEGIALGLGMVHQHFMLVDNLRVTENIVLGNEPGWGPFFDYKTAKKKVQGLAECYNFSIDPDARVEDLSVGQQQRVEIMKALYRQAEILILDEPTAVLTPGEVEDLFKVIRQLRAYGVSVIIITHKLEEVLAIAERVYILRRGKLISETPTTGVSHHQLARLMVGRNVILAAHREQQALPAEPRLVIKDLFAVDDRGLPALNGISLTVSPGELVGIAGVDGNGQSELAETLIGTRKATHGSITLNGRDLTGLSPRERRRCAFSYVPADRHRHGLILPMSMAENTILGSHDAPPFRKGALLIQTRIKAFADKLRRKFDIRIPSIDTPVSSLSGGNQQKVILAREFDRDPEFLLVSQPTRGLDVGAIEYIHRRILQMRSRNTAILLISLELEELFLLSDRILVLYNGRIVRDFITENTTEAEVGIYMTGIQPTSAMENDNERK